MRKLLMLVLLSTLIFASACSKKKMQKKAECYGPVNEDCVCILIYDPVCGCDGTTYPNSCDAECNGVLVYKPGICK